MARTGTGGAGHDRAHAAPGPGAGAQTTTAEDAHVDGNALAGALAEVFAVDVTVCDCRCGGCGAVGALATARVYTRCPGAVARCAHCSAVLLVLTDTPAGRILRLGDGVTLRLPETANLDT